MVFSWLIGSVLSLMNAVMGVLPTGSWTADITSGSAVGGEISSYMSPLQAFIPVGLVVDMISFFVLVLAPAMLVYLVAQWAYKELPTILGFGP
jgi:hypothetical protein